MRKKKDRKRDVLIDLLGLAIGGNDFGRSRTVSVTLGSIMVLLGLALLGLSIISTRVFHMVISIGLIGIGLYTINGKRKRNSGN